MGLFKRLIQFKIEFQEGLWIALVLKLGFAKVDLMPSLSLAPDF
ncbi:MAG TPA: hypothetical protein VJJ81_04555 [Candidatus Babeliales bacterium]|nr:hypothetical protein [Candidatus Babeliales bacterium]